MLYQDGSLFDLQGNPIKPAAVRAVRSYQRAAIRKQTAGEAAFARLMGPVVKHGRIRYVKQFIFYVAPTISFRADFVFQDLKTIVEVDGPEHAKKVEGDAWRDRLLLELRGFRTLRVSNEDCIKRYLETRVRVVEFLLASPRGFKKYLRAYHRATRSPIALPTP